MKRREEAAGVLDNPRQEKFCQEYALTGNATAAYKAAGYSVKTDGAARANAARLLTYDSIQQRVREISAEARAQAERSAIADIREIRERITAILRGEREDARAADVIRAGEFLARVGGAEPEQPAVRVELSLSGKLARLRELLDDDGD